MAINLAHGHMQLFACLHMLIIKEKERRGPD